MEIARDAFSWRGVIASTRLVTWVRRASAGPPKDARFIGFLLLRRAVLAHIPPSRTRLTMAAVVRALPLAALRGPCFPRPARRAAQPRSTLRSYRWRASSDVGRGGKAWVSQGRARGVQVE